MSMPHLMPCGSWSSAISSDIVAYGGVKFGFTDINQEYVYFEEMRPTNDGKTTLVRKKINGNFEEVVPQDFNLRTKVHEYGGKSYFLKNGGLFFINFSDQRIYKIDQENKIEPVTPADKKIRYADVIFDKKRNLIFCVQEDHTKGGEAENTIIKIDLASSKKIVVASGHDFYSSLTLSPNKKKLSYICWDHPNMPWDESYLIENNLSEEGDLINPRQIAGGKEESVLQPQYSSDNILFFISDKTGFYNIYYFKDLIESLFPMEADFAYPQWLFGQSSYCFVEKEGRSFIYCSYTKKGQDFLAEVSIEKESLKILSLPFSYYFSLKAYKDQIVFIAASSLEEKSIVLLDAKTNTFEIIKRSRDRALDKSSISLPEVIEFPTREGHLAYGFFYPPTNPSFVSTKDELPPLIVNSHGGPTAHFTTILNLEIQYFTSRGYAVMDVNYSGSSGYGRAYRERLKGKWGILDVNDCADAALYLCKQKRVDSERVVIRGSSAGGYTTLAALTFLDLFKAGASYYGVSDLKSLAIHTHKFESHYLDNLVGPYPEKMDIYESRSPINFLDRLYSPIILFQGGEDKIVPKEQSEILYEALKKKKIPTAFLLFENEQHGFRQAKNVKMALEAELYFYSKIFGIPIKEKLKPIKIDNL